MVGLLSALMSSGDSFLNIISISAIKDLVGWKLKNPKTSRSSQWMLLRMATILFGVIALAMALVFPYIVDLMVVGISTITIFAPITLFALIKKEKVYCYRKAALWSILSGFVLNALLFVWGILIPEQFEPKNSFVPAFIVATLVLIIGVKLTKTKMKAI